MNKWLIGVGVVLVVLILGLVSVGYADSGVAWSKIGVQDMKPDVVVLWCNDSFCVQDNGVVCYQELLDVEKVL